MNITIRHDEGSFQIRPIAIILDPEAFKRLAPDGQPCVIGYNFGGAMISVPIAQAVADYHADMVDHIAPKPSVERDCRAPLHHISSTPTLAELIKAHEKYADDAYRGSWQQAELQALKELAELRKGEASATVEEVAAMVEKKPDLRLGDAVKPKSPDHTHAGSIGVITSFHDDNMDVRIVIGPFSGEYLITSQNAWVKA